MRDTSTAPASPYAAAFHLTFDTIVRRARHYRNLVVAVVVILFVSTALAALSARPEFLAGLSVLLPACGLFVFLDAKLLHQWAKSLLDAWAKQQLDLVLFSQAISANSSLPASTLRSMLKMLPSPPDFHRLGNISPVTRHTTAEVTNAINQYHLDRFAYRFVTYTLVAIACVCAVATHIWQPLVAIALVPLVELMRNRVQRRRLDAAARQVQSARKVDEFQPESYARLISTLDWDGIQDRYKTRIISDVNNPRASAAFR